MRMRSQPKDCNEPGPCSRTSGIYIILNMSNPSSKAPSYVMLCTSTVRPPFHRSKINMRYIETSALVYALTRLCAVNVTPTTSARWWNLYERSNDMRNEIGPGVENLTRIQYSPLRVQVVQPHLQLLTGRSTIRHPMLRLWLPRVLSNDLRASPPRPWAAKNSENMTHVSEKNWNFIFCFTVWPPKPWN